MSEQQVQDLLAAMVAQTQAQKAQTLAINRLAESNEALASIIYKSLVEDENEPELPQNVYLSGKPGG